MARSNGLGPAPRARRALPGGGTTKDGAGAEAEDRGFRGKVEARLAAAGEEPPGGRGIEPERSRPGPGGGAFGGMTRSETVSFVGLLDTIAPDIIQELQVRDDEMLVGLAGEQAERWGWTFTFPHQSLHGLPLEEKLRRVDAALRAQGPVPEGYAPARLEEAFRGVWARVESGRGYVPGRFRGTVTLFRAGAPAAYRDALFAGRTAREERVLGWSKHVDGEVEVHTLPGTHATLAAEPHVGALAERMRESLAAGRARADGARTAEVAP